MSTYMCVSFYYYTSRMWVSFYYYTAISCYYDTSFYFTTMHKYVCVSFYYYTSQKPRAWRSAKGMRHTIPHPLSFTPASLSAPE